MLTGCPAVSETLPVLVVGGWSAQLLMICWPLMNSRLPSSLASPKLALPVGRGVGAPVHLAAPLSPPSVPPGDCSPRLKLTVGSTGVKFGLPDSELPL